MLVIYDHDSNIILAHALKTIQAAEITAAWKKLYDTITQHDHTTTYWIIDNEASAYLKNALAKNDQQLQLTPPHMHRINAAERAIRTYKNHLLAGLATCDENFPINEWDRLIPAANITINLLRNSIIKTKLSSYAAIFGNFNFNSTPLCPPGTKAIIHYKPNK